MMEKRILSIWLPRLAIERWAKSDDARPDEPVALTEEAAHGPMIVAVTDAAAKRGARPGMRLTDARALDPGLQAVAADAAGDAALLGRLARWAGRWSPLVEVDGADGLRLDVTGVAHLFGGEAGLSEDVERRFAGLGLTVRVAIAETAGAAWALARFSPSPLGGERLDALPVAALRLPPGPTRTLELLGLKTIGRLAEVPRRSLARRFREADNVLDALDRMLGRKAEPLSATPCEPPPRSVMRLAEPVVDPAVGGQALAKLVPELVEQLAARRLGARRLCLAGYRVDGSVAEASVATAIPSRDPAHLLRLMADRAAALDPGFGFDAFALEASWCEPPGAAQDSLVEEPRGEVEVARLVDRLSVKLGADRVRRPVARESHVPERASGWRAAVDSPSPLGRGREPHSGGRVRGVKGSTPLTPLACGESPASGRSCPARSEDCRGQSSPDAPARGEGLRPQRLLDTPEAIAVIYATPEGLPRRFVWRRGVHDLARVEGPERISPEWWRERGSARLRDYYRVEDQAGRRFWIYREGLFGDGRGGAPIWYMHGLFG